MNASRHPDSFDSLTAEIQAYIDGQGLPQLSVDELLHEDISDDQRRELSALLVRWEELEAHAAAEREAFGL